MTARWICGDKAFAAAVSSWQPERGSPERCARISLPAGAQGPARSLLRSRRNALSLRDGALEGMLNGADAQICELGCAAPIVASGNFEGDFSGWKTEADAAVASEGRNKALKARFGAKSARAAQDLTHRIIGGKTCALKGDLKSSSFNSGVTVFAQVGDFKNKIISPNL